MSRIPATSELSAPHVDSTIPIATHTLSFRDQTIFDILVNRNEGDGITESIVNQSFAFPPPFDLLPALARPGQRVLDLGAHIGTFSLLAAKLGYEVAAVEASPRNATLLQASVKHNKFDHLRVIPVAVSNQSETLNFIEAGPYGLVATAYPDAPSVAVPAMSVDEILANLAWDSVDLIKMDVEGSEIKAVAGMSHLLARQDAPAILFEANGHTLHYFNETPNRLLAALEAFGYSCYLIEPGQLIPLRASELLFSCTMDCLATKAPPRLPQGWQITTPLTREMRIAHIRAMANFPHPHLRSYIARTLRDADPNILRDQRVLLSLAMLTRDADDAVRADAAWFPSNRFRLPLSHKYKLLALIQRYIDLAVYLFQQRRK